MTSPIPAGGEAVTARPRGSYGIDAPWVPWLWLGLALLYVVFAALSGPVWGNPWPVGAVFALIALVFAAGAAVYWHATLRGKFAVWAEILNGESTRDVRHAADLGCGRGAVAIAVALRAPAARVSAIDLWRSVDQSGNGPDALRRNAEANGVAERIDAVTGDMTRLPYEDGEFDLVTASLSIHNIPSPTGRAAAIAEAWRVLAPGGELVVVDLRRTAEYATVLTRLGAEVSGPRPLGWRMWWSGPWMTTSLLRVRKPGRVPAVG